MAENTKIQWCDHTFNPWIGCTKVAEGCEHCYAEELMDHRYHRVEWGPRGMRQRTKTWGDPLRWNREAKRDGVRRKVFCASLADIFEDRAELIAWRMDLFDLIDKCGNLDFLLLTKRPQNIIGMWPANGPTLRENVWLGTSIANQKNAETAIDRLIETKRLAEHIFLSIEPQIDAVDLGRWLFPVAQLDWVITGGESKQGKSEPRLYDTAWARLLVRQCAQAGVPCFVKQLGSHAINRGRRMDLEDGHGGNMEEWPDDLRVRLCPESYFPTLC
jgi:protein gp37